MNPYQVPVQRISRGLRDWQSLLPDPLPLKSDPLRRARLLLAAAALEDAPPPPLYPEARRQAALIRRVERQQRLRFLSLLPHERPCEQILFSLFTLQTLTASAALAEKNAALRAVMGFLLPENCDMLYRAANLLSLEYGVSADTLLQGQAELMPGRPCIAAHRHPYDDVLKPLERPSARSFSTLFLLQAASRSAARLTANALSVRSPRARALYAELSLILSGHATQYSSLMPGTEPGLALLLRAYAHCSLFSDLAEQEAEPALAGIFREARDAACAHLQKARSMLPSEAVPFLGEELPPPLALRPHKGTVRDALRGVGVTLRRGEQLPVGTLPAGADFFRYQERINADIPHVPSHAVVAAHILKTGCDFRSELAPHPVEMLRSRTADPVAVGR